MKLELSLHTLTCYYRYEKKLLMQNTGSLHPGSTAAAKSQQDPEWPRVGGE